MSDQANLILRQLNNFVFFFCSKRITNIKSIASHKENSILTFCHCQTFFCTIFRYVVLCFVIVSHRHFVQGGFNLNSLIRTSHLPIHSYLFCLFSFLCCCCFMSYFICRFWARHNRNISFHVFVRTRVAYFLIFFSIFFDLTS